MVRTSLILGGNGALGKAMVSSFKQGGWRVVSMDFKKNTDACENIIVEDKALKSQITKLADSTRAASKGYDAIIISSGSFEAGSVKDSDIFEVYDRVDKANFQSALLGGHLASHFLNQKGFLMFTGAAAVFEGPVNFAYAYSMSKSATHALALHMAERTEIPESSSVVTILPQVIDTPGNREAMPDADHKTWTPPNGIAKLVE